MSCTQSFKQKARAFYLWISSRTTYTFLPFSLPLQCQVLGLWNEHQSGAMAKVQAKWIILKIPIYL